MEEIIDGKIVLSMRAIYQSKVGLGIMDKGNYFYKTSLVCNVWGDRYLISSMVEWGAGAKELLQSISEKQGRKMNSAESVKDIPPFLKFFKASRYIVLLSYFLFCFLHQVRYVTSIFLF